MITRAAADYVWQLKIFIKRAFGKIRGILAAKEHTHNLNAKILGFFNFSAFRIENEIELLTTFLFSVFITGKRMTEKGKLSTTETQFHF